MHCTYTARMCWNQCGSTVDSPFINNTSMLLVYYDYSSFSWHCLVFGRSNPRTSAHQRGGKVLLWSRKPSYAMLHLFIYTSRRLQYRLMIYRDGVLFGHRHLFVSFRNIPSLYSSEGGWGQQRLVMFWFKIEQTSGYKGHSPHTMWIAFDITTNYGSELKQCINFPWTSIWKKMYVLLYFRSSIGEHVKIKLHIVWIN